MLLTHHFFWHQKGGNRPEEYEDAYAKKAEAGRFAMADGTSTSAYSAFWAQLLVKSFVEARDGTLETCVSWLPAAQREWMASFEGRNLSYADEAHFRSGSFATFLGVLFSAENEDDCRWNALAVGDTCVFQTRGNELLHAFPIDRSDRFKRTTRLVCSRVAIQEFDRKLCEKTPQDLPGCLQDRFWLMTDALSQWFLREHESGKLPWIDLEWLFELHPDTANERFGQWVERLRKERQINNDDATLAVIQLT